MEGRFRTTQSCNVTNERTGVRVGVGTVRCSGLGLTKNGKPLARILPYLYQIYQDKFSKDESRNRG